jgi:hypothetical protein
MEAAFDYGVIFPETPGNSPDSNGNIRSFDSSDSPLRGESATLRMTKLSAES